jgi:DNA gyrase/topoisomerase IV subunit A
LKSLKPFLVPPPKVSDIATKIDKLIFIEDYKSYKNDAKELENALMALFDVIIGQCSPLLKSKLKALQSWDDMEAKCEIGLLLKEIKSITHQFQANISIYEALDEAKRQYYMFRQNHQHMNTITYMKTLKNIINVIEFYGGSISDDPALIAYEKEVDSKNNISGITGKEYATCVHNKMLAIGALCHPDKSMYSHILHDMRNQYQLGNDCYPNYLTKAFDLLQNYHGPLSHS